MKAELTRSKRRVKRKPEKAANRPYLKETTSAMRSHRDRDNRSVLPCAPAHSETPRGHRRNARDSGNSVQVSAKILSRLRHERASEAPRPIDPGREMHTSFPELPDCL